MSRGCKVTQGVMLCLEKLCVIKELKRVSALDARILRTKKGHNCDANATPVVTTSTLVN